MRVLDFKNIIFGIIVQVGLLPILQAQDSTDFEAQHLLGLFSGISSNMVRDDILSPLLYRGSQFPILLSYRHRGMKSHEKFTAYYEHLQLSSSITDESTSSHYAMNTKAFFEYRYCRNAFTLPAIKTKCSLGGNVSGFMNWKDFYYLKDIKATSVDLMIGLGVDALFETTLREISHDIITTHIHIPILSYVLLNDRYNVNVNNTDYGIEIGKSIFWQVFTHGDFVTLNKFFEVRAEVSYTKFIGRSLGIELTYRFQFYRFAQYAEILHAHYLNNQLLLGLIVQL